jgi:hypothetical protein
MNFCLWQKAYIGEKNLLYMIAYYLSVGKDTYPRIMVPEVKKSGVPSAASLKRIAIFDSKCILSSYSMLGNRQCR